VGAAAYLLPSFADGRHGRGDQLPEATDIQLAPANVDTSGGALLSPYSLPAEKWQNLPLLALRSSTEAAAGNEVQRLALQAAFERERSSAAAAHLQVIALREQLANMQEKQEEVLILREQLADTRADKEQATGPTIAETEQKKLAEHALLKVTALQQELASLSTQVLKARTTVESEKARAASAFAQLEAVQHQLAIVTALRSDRTEADSHLGPKDDHIVDEPALNSLRHAHSAERASRLPLPPEIGTASSVNSEPTPHRSIRQGKGERVMVSKPRQALLSIGMKPQARPVNSSAAAPSRTPEPGASRLKRSREEPGIQSVQSVGKIPQRASQQPRLLAQDTQSRRDSGPLSLPNKLLPDSRLW
jgi:hypothetical protein